MLDKEDYTFSSVKLATKTKSHHGVVARRSSMSKEYDEEEAVERRVERGRFANYVKAWVGVFVWPFILARKMRYYYCVHDAAFC